LVTLDVEADGERTLTVQLTLEYNANIFKKDFVKAYDVL